MNLLAIDLGTTSCKAALYGGDGGSREARLPVATRYLASGRAEQDPEEWWATIGTLVRSLGAGASQLDGIAVSAQSDSLVAIAADGSAIRPCLLWMDSRGAPQAARFATELGEPAIHEHTGLRSDRSFTAAKLAWVRDEEPDTFARLRWMAQPKDFLVQRLTGRMVTDPSTASRSLVYDSRAGRWWAPMVEQLGLDPGQLPEVIGSADIAGGLTASAADHLGLPQGTPVAVGGADRACEALALALRSPRVMVASGTATGVTTTSRSRVQAGPNVLNPCHVVPAAYLVHFSVPTSGAVLDWFAAISGEDRSGSTLAALLGEASMVPPGSNDVVFRPSFMGMRSIHWDPDARGAIHGLSLATRRGDIARAILEGIGFEVLGCLDALAAGGFPAEEVALLGAVHEEDWACQLMADLLGRPCFRVADPHPALTGAMLLAGTAVGAWTDPEAEAARRLRRSGAFDPDPALMGTYADLAARYVRVAYDTQDPPARPPTVKRGPTEIVHREGDRRP